MTRGPGRPITESERAARASPREELAPEALGGALLNRLAARRGGSREPQGIARMAAAAGNRAIAALLREPAPDAGTATRDAGPARRDAGPVPDGGTATPDGGAGMAADAGKKAIPAPAWATDEFKRTLAAVILAESADGQEGDIRWIYLQRVTAAGGAAGLKASSAYKGKGIWYRIWLYILGDQTHGADPLPVKKEFEDYKDQTIADFCTKNGWIKTVATPRAKGMVTQVEEMFTAPETNPYKGWEGQGNLADFNNESNDDVYWKRARAYYWLQQERKVDEIHVKVLPAGKSTQVLFNAKAIAAYWASNALPADVPKYTP